MKRLTTFKKVQGFTIMEALIAFVVFALGALAIASFLGRSLEMNADGEARTVALHLAKEKIEYFRNFKSMAEVEAYTDGTGAPITGNNAIFTPSWAFEQVNVDGKDNAILLTVDVAWQDWSGEEGVQKVSLKSEIAKLNPKLAGSFLLSSSPGPGPGDDGESDDGESDDGESDDGESDDGESDDGEGDDGESADPPVLYSCTCVWEEQSDGKCDDLDDLFSSPPSAESCCSEAACVKPDKKEKACKNQDYVYTYSCSGDLPADGASNDGDSNDSDDSNDSNDSDDSDDSNDSDDSDDSNDSDDSDDSNDSSDSDDD